MENKTNKGLVWLVVILIILVIALMGFVIYREFYSDNKTENNNITEEKTTSEKIETTTTAIKTEKFPEKEAEKYLSYFRNFDKCSDYEWKFDNKNKITFNDMTDKEKNLVVANYEYINNENLSELDSCVAEPFSISEEKMLNNSEKIFGTREINFLNSVETAFVKFVKKSDSNFEASYVGCFGCEENSSGYYMISSNIVNNKLEIKVAYVDYVTESNFNDNGEENVKVMAYKGNTYICDTEDIDNHLSSFVQYKFTFTKQNTNYVFESIEKIN